MKYSFGFIGTGNMGSALATAVAAKVGGDKVLVCDKDMAKAQAVAEKLGAVAGNISTVAAECKYIFLGVKPQMMAGMLAEIADVLKTRQDKFVLVTMAAGLTLDTIAEMAGIDAPVIRIMPNTPASVGKGMILYCPNTAVSAEDESEFVDAMSGAGSIDKLPEALIDAGSAVSGCGPAFVYMFIGAMADGGVKCGLPRDKALKYAAETVMGAAEMVLKTGKHTEELKDAVCSPAGSTIEGVSTLENFAFRASVETAVVNSFERTKELGKK